MKASETLGTSAAPNPDMSQAPAITMSPTDALPDHLKQFMPLSERQTRFVADLQRITNGAEWPSFSAMKVLEIIDARSKSVERRRELLRNTATTMSVLGIINECHPRRTSQYTVT